MIIKREDEIIGTLIQKDPKAEKIYRKACYYKVDEEFGREVYNYNLEIRACDIDMVLLTVGFVRNQSEVFVR